MRLYEPSMEEMKKYGSHRNLQGHAGISQHLSPLPRVGGFPQLGSWHRHRSTAEDLQHLCLNHFILPRNFAPNCLSSLEKLSSSEVGAIIPLFNLYFEA